ncbi:MAG: hypothetical protein WBA76_11135 [Phormidesmis sp.]
MSDITFCSAKSVTRTVGGFALGAIATLSFLSLQSCSPTQAAEPCTRLQEITSTASPPAQQRILPIDKATATYTAKQQAMLAEQLIQLPILDKKLSAERDRLIELYRLDSSLGLQMTAFMGAGGDTDLTGSDRIAYEQVASQRIALDEAIKNQLAVIRSYCRQ